MPLHIVHEIQLSAYSYLFRHAHNQVEGGLGPPLERGPEGAIERVLVGRVRNAQPYDDQGPHSAEERRAAAGRWRGHGAAEQLPEIVRLGLCGRSGRNVAESRSGSAAGLEVAVRGVDYSGQI